MHHIQIKSAPVIVVILFALVAMAAAFGAGWGVAESRHASERTRLDAQLTEYKALSEAAQEMAQKSLDHAVETQVALTSCMLRLRAQRHTPRGR